MQTKPLLYGLIGFFIGGFIVSVAATTFDKPKTSQTVNDGSSMSEMTMGDMTADLRNKTGDAYDKGFIASMIVHHEGAIVMAKLSAERAKHDEIKQLSNEIISAQEKEIAQMKAWQSAWSYPSANEHRTMSH